MAQCRGPAAIRKRLEVRHVLILLLALGGPVQAGVCDDRGAMLSRTAPPEVALRLPDNGIKVGVLFALDVEICATGWDLVGADARMPLHGHGMNYAPTIETANGAARTDGWLFHMPGTWDITLLVTDGDEIREVGFTLDITQ